MSWQNKIIAITPFLCLIVFVLLLEYTDWKYSWTVFFLIPLMPFLVGKAKIRFSYPFVIAVIYVTLGIIFQGKWWHPGWVIFLLIPVIEILKRPSDRWFKIYTSKVKNTDE